MPGVMVVDWLIRWCFAKSREDAAVLSQELLRLAHIQVLKASSKERAPSPHYSCFMDSENAYYRFVSTVWSSHNVSNVF